VCKKDKVSGRCLVCSNQGEIGAGGNQLEVSGIRMLKNKVSEAVCVLCSNLERKSAKKSTLLFQRAEIPGVARD
jgi:hypothetical protein